MIDIYSLRQDPNAETAIDYINRMGQYFENTPRGACPREQRLLLEHLDAIQCRLAANPQTVQNLRLLPEVRLYGSFPARFQ